MPSHAWQESIMPDWSHEIRNRLHGLRLSPAREAEILEELSLHLDARYEELIASGSSPEEARVRATADLSDPGLLRHRLGGLRQAHVTEPVVPGVPRRRLLADLWQDVRHAARMLRKQRGLTAAATITLALGIGANAAIFSLVDATLFRRLPVRDSASLVYVLRGSSGIGLFSYPDYALIRETHDAVEDLQAWAGIAASLNADGQTDLVSGAIVTGGFFQLLGLSPAAGRLLSPQDDVSAGAHPVVVIGDALWHRRFAAGRTSSAARCC